MGGERQKRGGEWLKGSYLKKGEGRKDSRGGEGGKVGAGKGQQ